MDPNGETCYGANFLETSRIGTDSEDLTPSEKILIASAKNILKDFQANQFNLKRDFGHLNVERFFLGVIENVENGLFQSSLKSFLQVEKEKFVNILNIDFPKGSVKFHFISMDSKEDHWRIEADFRTFTNLIFDEIYKHLAYMEFFKFI